MESSEAAGRRGRTRWVRSGETDGEWQTSEAEKSEKKKEGAGNGTVRPGQREQDRNKRSSSSWEVCIIMK